MKRRVVLHGPSTLTISLPSDWVKKFDVKKGDELNVEDCGRELRVNVESTSFRKKCIEIGNLRRVGKSCVTSSYRQGYDELELSYDSNEYLKTIRDLINKDIMGFEIVRQQGGSCVLKDLTGHAKDEFEVALRRVWLLLLDLSSESLSFVKKGLSDVENIKAIDCSINKFSNYCLRVLIKKGRYDNRKTPSYYHFVRKLEEIGDRYKDLCIFCAGNLKEKWDNLAEIFERTNSYLNSVYELFYRYDERKIEDLFEEIKVSCDRASNPHSGVAFYLLVISRDIRDLLPLLVEINM